jgi:hypothetical protein
VGVYLSVADTSERLSHQVPYLGQDVLLEIHITVLGSSKVFRRVKIFLELRIGEFIPILKLAVVLTLFLDRIVGQVHVLI